MEQKLHTPEGVRDIYNDECKRKGTVQEELHRILHLYGYQDIQTPTFEYFDVFRKEIGTIPSRELYKFFDREGNTLALRPDVTPSIARAAATLFEDEDFPIRLCYIGNTFMNQSSYQGRLKENTQLGAELIGVDSAQADAEMIAMVVNGLKKVGLEEFLVNVGHVDFIRSLLESAGLSPERLEEIRGLIANRNYFGVEEVLDEEKAADSVKKAFAILPELTGGGEEILEKALPLAFSDSARSALRRLGQIYDILKLYGVEDHVMFDLSMSGNYGYYTGIIFRAYTYGTGDAVVRGGRYDHLLEKFGKDTPSIGFAIIIDELLGALSWQKIPIPVRHTHLVVYVPERTAQAIAVVAQLRAKGCCTEMLQQKDGETREDYLAYGKRTRAVDMRYLGPGDEIEKVDFDTGEALFAEEEKQQGEQP